MNLRQLNPLGLEFLSVDSSDTLIELNFRIVFVSALVRHDTASCSVWLGLLVSRYTSNELTCGVTCANVHETHIMDFLLRIVKDPIYLFTCGSLSAQRAIYSVIYYL